MNSAQSKTTTMRHYRTCSSRRSQRAANDTATSATRIAQRVGFTLVELLMVIVIIGILVGMLAVAINPVLTSTREFAVTQEIAQMDLAIESFKTKYGFYPPSFTGFLNTPDGVAPDPAHAAQLLPYLNKISPNHQENSAMLPGGLSRLQVWWIAFGSELDDRGSLIFWLTGLSTNKQFPITGNLPTVDVSGGVAVAGTTFAQLPIIANADFVVVVDGMGVVQNGGNNNEFDMVGTMERESLFDFKGGQLTRDGAQAGIRIYNQAFGNDRNDLAYRYRNAAFYNLPDPDPANPSVPIPGRSADAFHVSTLDANGMPSQIFLNPSTFQIITFGLDGKASGYATSAINKPTTGEGGQLQEWASTGNDNIANFANGRIDGFDWTEAVELGSQQPH